MKLFIMLLCLVFSVLVLGQNTDAKLEAIVQSGHSKYVSASDISPDGKHLASGSLDYSIIIWEVKSGKQIRTLHHHVKQIIAVHFSPDGKTILSGSSDNTVKLSDVLTGEVIHEFKHDFYDVNNVYFGAEGQYVIIIDKRGRYSIWSVKTGVLIGKYTKSYGDHQPKDLVSKDGLKCLVKVNDKKVACVSLITKDTLFIMPFDKAYSMRFGSDDKKIVISSAKLFASVFDAETGQILFDLENVSRTKCDGCNTKIDVNGQKVFTISSKSTGALWHLKNGKKIIEIEGLNKRPSNVLLSNDGKYILISFGKTIVVYNLETGRKTAEINNETLKYFEIKIHQNKVVLPGENQTVELRSLPKLKLIKSFKGYLNKDKADGLRFSYTNWIDVGILQYISYKTELGLSIDNKEIAIGKIDSSVMVLDIQTGRKIKTISEASKSIFAQTYSPDGKWLALAGGDRIIRIYDTETYNLAYTLKGCQELIFDLEFNEESNLLVSGSWDGIMRVWQFKNEKMLKYVKLEKGSPYIVKFSPQSLYVLTGDLDKNLDFWEFDSETKFRSLIGHVGPISGIDFAKNGQEMVTSSWDGKLKLWHVLTGMQMVRFKSTNAPIYTAKFALNGIEIITGDADRNIHFWDKKTGKLNSTLKGHTTAVTDIKQTSDGRLMISRGANGEVIVWDIINKKELYTYLQINRNDWLARTPKGHFDGSKEALKLVNYVSGLEVIAIESLFDKFYTPNLVERIMSGEKLSGIQTGLEELIKERPVLKFELSESDIRTVNVEGEQLIESPNKSMNIDVSIIKNAKSLKGVKLYNNGKLIESENNFSQIQFRGTKTNLKSFNVELINGNNLIKAVAINNNNIESDPIFLNVNFNSEAAKTDLYILSIGINKYKNSAYNLNYAVNDAKDFTNALKDGGQNLFNKIYNYQLTNEKATKENVMTYFSQLKNEIGQEDVFVFYYAGHGIMTIEADPEKSDFYIVAHGMTNFYGGVNLLSQEAISATELLNFSRDVKAQKQLFILDACHSGGALETFASRGDGREKTIAQLARNTGTFFLTASQDVQYANEAGDLKHGLFTYSLLEILLGNDTQTKADNKITVNEIKTYVEERVPELSEKYQGTSQYPTSYSFGQDFPIVLIK